MPTSYSPNLGLALPVTGELNNTWGELVRDEIVDLLEHAVAGRKTINSWSNNSHTLVTGDGVDAEYRYAILNLTDTQVDLSGAGELICQITPKVYIIQNNTSQTITVKTPAGSGVTVNAGDLASVFCDGTDVQATSGDQTAAGISFTPAGGLVSTDVQAALTELAMAEDQTAAQVPFTPAGGLVSTNVQAALTELATSPDQIAAEVPFTPSGGLFSTNVQAALAELDTKKANVGEGGGGGGTGLQPGDNISLLTNNVGYLNTVSFGILTGKPTTRNGYGITDVPLSNGSGATGTWNINILGNAASATTATSAANATNATTAAACSGNSATATTATNALAVDGKSIQVDAGSPSGTDPNTIYFVT